MPTATTVVVAVAGDGNLCQLPRSHTRRMSSFLASIYQIEANFQKANLFAAASRCSELDSVFGHRSIKCGGWRFMI
ncbi:hypothetical protein KSS87_020213 [Heliosperma pusillum]|nr:hypothetical protein KSS87_020213 [Heliosperma pusillum]